MQGTRKFLFTPSFPLWRYCLLAWPIALVPSVALVAGAYSLLALAGANMAELGPPERSTTLAAVLGTVVFAPVVETLALAALLRLLSSLSENATLVAAASAVVWGCLHALFGALWFFGTVWSFFVFSCAYLAWRKASFRRHWLRRVCHTRSSISRPWRCFSRYRRLTPPSSRQAPACWCLSAHV